MSCWNERKQVYTRPPACKKALLRRRWSDGEVVDSLTQFDDPSGKVVALALGEVRWPDEDFAGAALRARDLVDLEDFGAAVRVNFTALGMVAHAHVTGSPLLREGNPAAGRAHRSIFLIHQ